MDSICKEHFLNSTMLTIIVGLLSVMFGITIGSGLKDIEWKEKLINAGLGRYDDLAEGGFHLGR